MIRAFYNFIFYLSLPYMIFHLYWKGLKSRNYRKRIHERFAYFKQPAFTESIWIHAVSMGETIAVAPLVKKLQTDYPKLTIVMTNTTPSGAERVKALCGESVFQLYAPYDTPGSVKRFLKKIKPKCLILVETELWPNYLYYCQQQGIPTVLFNGRLSDRSTRRYLKIPALARRMMNDLVHIIAQTELDANNFKKLGADPANMTVTGSVKFDLVVPESALNNGAMLRAQLGIDRPVWMAASTHEGEEKIILAAHRDILKRFPNALLILVPRHSDRFDQIAALCHESGFATVRRSSQQLCPAGTQIYVGDTMGEMLLLYAACDLAFVGGSFVPVGGHNMLEPAALKKPVLSGPCVINFLVISDLLTQAGGMKIVSDANVLSADVIRLFSDPEQARIMGEYAFELVRKNRGSLDKQFGVIKSIL